MTRRDWAVIASCGLLRAAASDEKPPPVSEAAWNDFAGRGNYYAAQLQRGVIDIKAWSWVLRAWRALR